MTEATSILTLTAEHIGNAFVTKGFSAGLALSDADAAFGTVAL
jgi:hypothetical protein